MVDLDAAFREQLFDIAVGEPVTEIPPDRHHDHLGRETEPCERRPGRRPETRTRRMLHRSSLP
jgi:hypothetical protein